MRNETIREPSSHATLQTIEAPQLHKRSVSQLSDTQLIHIIEEANNSLGQDANDLGVQL